MADHSELKRLAEACGTLNWRFQQENWTEYAIRDDHGYIATMRVGSPKQAGPDPDREAKAKFLGAMTPGAVLALIADNERMKTLRSKTEREFAQELEVWRRGPSCWNCGDTGDVHDIVGEWRGKCDCFAAQLIDATQERDQLRAENAGYKTGYEAYEQVNAGLKTKVEGLRKALAECANSLHGEMLQKYHGQKPEGMHPVTRRDYDRDMSEQAGYAAMSKGEQS
ncbi:hypothetical protein ACIGCH_01160 [Pseudomonas helleri]|uniref:hypothetical protein n=1 Tax=Pseudomonas helleri TaxID=1608996 RepID=UPI0037C7D471